MHLLVKRHALLRYFDPLYGYGQAHCSTSLQQAAAQLHALRAAAAHRACWGKSAVGPPMRPQNEVYLPGALGGLGTVMPMGSTLTAAVPVDSMVGATAISAGVMVTPSGLHICRHCHTAAG